MNAKYRVLRISPFFWIALFLAISIAYASDFSTKHDNPISNASACGDCHQAPQLGGSSPTTVTRVGHLQNGRYMPGPNGGLAHTRPEGIAIPDKENIRGLRVSLNLLGDGYIEAIPDDTLRAISIQQRRVSRGVIYGEPIEVSILESATREKHIGRFGWKSQHATLVSAAADALHNELGIPNYLYIEPLVPQDRKTGKTAESENNKKTSDTAAADAELQEFVRFIRSSEPLAQDADLAQSPIVKNGQQLFEKIGCGICHVSSLETSAAGTVINNGTYKVPEQLGGKIIHPYSDYLLHDVGTGDRIVQASNPSGVDLSPSAQQTANKFRTAPLWGLRYRTWLMHDGQSKTYDEAIARHQKEAEIVVHKYRRLNSAEQRELQSFLDSL